MINTGAQVLIGALEKQGVEVIFGYPGGAILPVFHSLSKSNIKLVSGQTFKEKVFKIG